MGFVTHHAGVGLGITGVRVYNAAMSRCPWFRAAFAGAVLLAAPASAIPIRGSGYQGLDLAAFSVTGDFSAYSAAPGAAASPLLFCAQHAACEGRLRIEAFEGPDYSAASWNGVEAPLLAGGLDFAIAAFVPPAGQSEWTVPGTIRVTGILTGYENTSPHPGVWTRGARMFEFAIDGQGRAELAGRGEGAEVFLYFAAYEFTGRATPVDSVPEPGTWLTVACGAAVLGLAGRRGAARRQ